MGRTSTARREPLRPAAAAVAPRVRALSRMPTLDGLRFVAVVLTSAVHLYPRAVPGGLLGVDIFFVLSGFLITVLLLTSADGHGRIPLKRFYLRRTRRLLPAVSLLLVTFAIWVVASGPTAYNLKVAAVVIGSVVAYVFNWAGVLGHEAPWQVDHLWSLSVEEQFYLVWPVLLMLIIRRCRPRVVMAVTASAAAASVLAQTVAWLVTGNVNVVYLASPLRAEGILLGCLLAQAYVWGSHEGVVTWLARARWPLLATGLVVAGLSLTMGIDDSLTYEGGMALGVLSATVMVASLVAKETTGSVSGLLRATLGNRVMVGLGKRSYSIYLWQNPVAWALTTPLLDSYWWLPANVAGTLICAQISYVCVERPFLRRRKAPSHQVGPAQVQSAPVLAARDVGPSAAAG